MGKNSTQSIKKKIIELKPSTWSLDVWIGDVKNELVIREEMSKLFTKYYGASFEYYDENLITSQVMTVDSTTDSLCKGESRIVLVLHKLLDNLLVHELVHVLWHSSKCIGYELNYYSQEWQAVFLERLFVDIKEDYNYIELWKK